MTGILGYLPALFGGVVEPTYGLMTPSRSVTRKGPGLHRTVMPTGSRHKLFRLSLKCSEPGLAFIFSIEVGPLSKLTAHPHWPGGSSGVTLGPGYDMKDRSRADVLRDLKALGLDAEISERVSAGAGLKGSAAEDFADDNDDSVNLSLQEQVSLLKLIVPRYEKIVIRNVHVPLAQHEFDALICFVYNPGGSFRPIAKAINEGHLRTAANLMKARVMTGGKTNKGLARRRERETRLLLTGHY